MARLTAAARKKIPAKKFAGPNRSFPIENRSHAIAALRDVERSVEAGHITEAEAAKIRGRAHRMLYGP